MAKRQTFKPDARGRIQCKGHDGHDTIVYGVWYRLSYKISSHFGGLSGRSVTKNLLLLIFIAHVFLNLTSFWVSDTSQLVDIFSDDAYYYFKIAKNVVKEGKWTFDGQTYTNGFHPLWMILLLPFFLVTSDSVLVLRMIGSFSTILLGISGYLSLRHVCSRYSPLSASLAAALVLGFTALFSRFSMETSILIPLCVVSMIMIDKMDLWLSLHTDARKLTVLGVILSLLQLARLDAVFLNFIILISCTIICYSKNRECMLKNIVIVSLPIFLTGSAYLTTNYITFKHIIPVSGLAKSMGSNLLNHKMIEQLTRDLANIWIIFSAMLVLTFFYILILLLRCRLAGSQIELSRNHYVSVIVSLFFLCFTCYHLLGTSWRLWRWYSYPALLVGIFVVPVIFETIKQCLEKFSIPGNLLKIASTFTVILILCGMSVAGFKWGYWSKRVTSYFKYQNYLIAESLNKEFNDSVRFAMGDKAGSFAYFFNGDVLQLEGLVGDHELLKAIEQNTLMDYMSRFGVDYVMSYVGPPQGYSQWTLLTPLPELSSGPHAEVLLCKKTELLRRETQAGTIFVWKWPSCTSSTRLKSEGG